MNLELPIRIAGGLQIALSLLHTVFPAKFQWREELARLSLINRQLFQVHTLFIALLVLLLGVLSLFFAPALLSSGRLSRLVLSGISFFWFARLLAQFFLYSPVLWRGNRFRTAVHILFSMLWAYLAAVYGMAAYGF